MKATDWKGVDTAELKQQYATITGFNPDHLKLIGSNTLEDLLFTYPLDKLEDFQRTIGSAMIQNGYISEGVNPGVITEMYHLFTTSRYK